MDEGVGDFFSGGGEDAREDGAGDAHLLGGIFLVEDVQVGEAQGFEFVEGQDDFLQVEARNAAGLEAGDVGDEVNFSGLGGPWHGNEHIPFMSGLSI